MSETSDLLARVADAIERASCPDREGPYGLYNYSRYPGAKQPHVVRDFRDPASDSYGAFIFRSNDPDEAQAHYDRLTREHIAGAAIAAMRGPSEVPGQPLAGPDTSGRT